MDLVRRLAPELDNARAALGWAGGSGGDLNLAVGLAATLAPLASAYGDIECDGFWNHTPPKTDKDGVWVPENVAIAPILTERARAFDTNIGRCRVIELQPNSYTDAIYNLHRDDNNRFNPENEGWVVRTWVELTDNPDSYMLLMDLDDKHLPIAGTERRAIELAGARPRERW